MRTARYILGLNGDNAIAGNTVRLLVDGREAFAAMLGAIAQAQHSISLESYIYATDGTAKRFLKALVQAASRGVMVRVLIDGLGSYGTDEIFFAPLLALGGELHIFHPLSLWRPSFLAWRRDHRKLLLVDETQAFIGGINIADAYAPETMGGGGWHDLHAEIVGPAAQGLARVFARTWNSGRMPPWRLSQRTPAAGHVTVQILESRVTRRSGVRRAYLHAIRRATHTVRLCNAYCIPDRGILRALKNACERGVRVQLLLAGTTDVPAVRYASRALYSRLMRYGVEIYEWTDHVLHAKSAVIDGAWCSLGSYNMDRRSLWHNLETNFACVDTALGAALDAQFCADIARSRRVDAQAWHRRDIWQKCIEQVCYRLRYLL